MELTAAEIDAKLDAIIEAIGGIKTANAVFDRRVCSLEETARENKQAIKGNGKAGLETRTTLLEKQMATYNWISGALLLVVLGDLIARVLGLIAK